jgi:hypothetical protein
MVRDTGPCCWAARVTVLAALLTGVGASCAGLAGQGASQGAVQGLRGQASNDPSQQVSRVLTGRAVVGALETLNEPQQQERLRAIVADSAEQTVAGALAALDEPAQRQRLRALTASVVEEVMTSALAGATAAGRGERGPAVSLAGEMARAAAGDAMHEVRAGLGASIDEVFPGCAGPDAEACRRRQLRGLTRDMGAGLSAGLVESLKWPLLIVAGGLGVLVGLLAHWLWTWRPRRRTGPGPLAGAGAARRGLREAGTHAGT